MRSHTDPDTWIGGQGAPVVLIHGLAASKVTVVPTLDDLAADHHVHAIDLPGFGRSGKPLPAVVATPPRRFAAEVALRHPDRVRGHRRPRGRRRVR